jgi:DNA-binding transcriptional regulator YiaG
MAKNQKRPSWDAPKIRALRRHLGLTQQELAAEMGTRQQTISDWETGAYAPRGTSRRLLSLIAERANFNYETASEQTETDDQ